MGGARNQNQQLEELHIIGTRYQLPERHIKYTKEKARLSETANFFLDRRSVGDLLQEDPDLQLQKSAGGDTQLQTSNIIF